MSHYPHLRRYYSLCVVCPLRRKGTESGRLIVLLPGTRGRHRGQTLPFLQGLPELSRIPCANDDTGGEDPLEAIEK
jgi:hypothetical protein